MSELIRELAFSSFHVSLAELRRLAELRDSDLLEARNGFSSPPYCWSCCSIPSWCLPKMMSQTSALKISPWSSSMTTYASALMSNRVASSNLHVDLREEM